MMCVGGDFSPYYCRTRFYEAVLQPECFFFKSWVSSSPLANLMLNVSICSVSLLWLLKWGSRRLFFQFAPRSLQVPWDSLLGREVCVLQKEKLDWGYSIVCGLLHI